MTSRKIRRVIIQCRLSSSRLPGKALLPLAGTPAVVLCAKRAASQGLPVVVATSTDPSDAALARLLAEHGIPFVLGPLDDVLGRFVEACRDLDDDAAIVRLTADNVFPDGYFLAELEGAWLSKSTRYLVARSPMDGHPYGLSAEVFEAHTLRAAAAATQSPHDREHVTPWIARTFGAEAFVSTDGDHSHLRCTLDTLDDYVRLAELFATESDPVGVHYRTLIRRLAEQRGIPTFRIPFRVQNGIVHSSMALGTVQLGLPYGAANTTGQPSLSESHAIVRTAIEHGVTALDTARAYGSAEARIGGALFGGLSAQVSTITKLAPLPEVTDATSEMDARNAVDASVFRSCRELRFRTLTTLLLHRFEHRTLCHGAIWRRLLELKSEGVIAKLGVSVDSVEDALRALDDKDVEHIQIPFNILDHRWESARFGDRARSRSDVVIHARSALLQGILAASPETWPRNGGDAQSFIERLETLTRKFDRDGRADLCLAYARGQSWITSVVVGIESLDQLHRNLHLFRAPPLTSAECEEARDMLGGASEILLNPARWEKR